MKAYLVFWKEESNLEEEMITIHKTIDCMKTYLRKDHKNNFSKKLIAHVTLNEKCKKILGDNDTIKVFDMAVEELVQNVIDIFQGQHALTDASIKAWEKYRYNTLNYRMNLKN